MTKTRLLLVCAAVVVTLGIAGGAEACPPCSQPWLWTGQPCLPTNCSICGWERICGGDVEFRTPLVTVETADALFADDTACGAADEASAPAVVAEPEADAPAAAGDVH